MIKVIAVLLAMVAFSSGFFAGECPPGAEGCFLCGGVDGIPCYQGPECDGVWSVSAHMNIACECPQGEPCVCYCPYSIYSGDGLEGATPSQCPPECTHGCSADGAICAKIDAGEIAGKGGVSISAFKGDVFIRRPGSGWARVSGKVALDKEYDILVTDGMAVLLFDDGSKVRMEENTLLRAHQIMYVDGRSTLEVIIDLVHGAITADVTKRDGTKFEVDCGVSTIGVKGTQFYVSHNLDSMKDTIMVYEGEVEVESASGIITLRGGQMVEVSKQGAGAPQYFDPRDYGFEPQEEGAACCAPAFIILATFTGLFFARGSIK